MGEKTEKTPVYKKWWFWVIIVVVLAAVGGASMSNKGNNQDGQNPQTSQNGGEQQSNTQQDDKNVKAGENFTFDELTLSVSPKYSFTTINNEFSKDNGKAVVVLPVTVTNNSNEAKALNMYSYKCYGAEGVELEKPSAYFQDEASDFAGNLQPGASYTKNLYFMYDGNGTYQIEFGYVKTEKVLSIDINK